MRPTSLRITFLRIPISIESEGKRFRGFATSLKCFRHMFSLLRFACVVNPLERLPSHFVAIFRTFNYCEVVGVPEGEEPMMSPKSL